MGDERDWVRFLASRFPARGAVKVGIGDDAAVIRLPAGPDWIFTTDQMVEGTHFVEKRQPAGAVGWKALARSLSDVAAMGGRPRFALVALTLPRRHDPKWTKAFFAGMGSLARRHGVQIVGGDFSSGRQLSADVQVIGEVRRGKALLRSGASPGQAIYVTGRLGLAALGERLARAPSLRQTAKGLARTAHRAHTQPNARLEVARKLPQGVSALMDLSDGLALDLHRLCEASGVGARLFRDLLPVPAIPAALLKRLKTSALQLALHGGEDYELLFTAPKKVRVPKSIAGVPVSRIGETTRGRAKRSAVVLCASEKDKTGKKLEAEGWDHFARRKSTTRR